MRYASPVFAAALSCTVGVFAPTLAHAATVVLLNPLVATAIDGVVVNGHEYDVTFANDFIDTTFANNPTAVAAAIVAVDAALNASTAAFVHIDGFGSIDNFVVGDRDAGGITTNSFSTAHNWHNFGSIFAPAVDADSVFTAVPEPSTWAMMLLGFAGLGALAAFRRTKPGSNAIAA